MQVNRFLLWIALLALALGMSARAESLTQAKDIFGWVERVQIGKSRLELEAKLDTGADTSSLDAAKIRRFRQKGGDRWVEFLVVDETSGRRIRYKKRLVRYAYIKEHEGPSQRRPVVRMEICLGSHLRDVEVSLVDRSGFQYPLLLGRNALEDIALVDASTSLTTGPECQWENGG